jgi:hypothetical protein
MGGADGLLRKTLGSQAVLCGYILPASRRWLIGDELEAQAFSADSLCVAEDLPVLCGHLAASRLAIDVLTEAGWELPERLLVFRNTEGLLTLILGESSQGRRVVTNFPLPEASIPAEVHLVSPSLRAMLNDKAILEEFLPFTSTRCFNYLIDGEGGVRFLGAPEQFLMDSRYLGNWFQAGDSPDPAAVAAGADTCRRAAALGYRGAAGFDAGFLRDGSFRFVDLNFRMNGSTASLLLVADLLRRCGAPAALRSGFRGRTSPRVLSSSLQRLISEARFFPLAAALSDVDAPETNFLVSGFLTGPDQAGILASAPEVTRRLLGR